MKLTAQQVYDKLINDLPEEYKDNLIRRAKELEEI